MPGYEDPLAHQRVLSLNNILSKVLAIVRHLSPHIVDEERLGEVVFVVRERHSFEVERHCGTALNIANLVAARGRVAVNIEELGNILSVLGEERVVASLFPLLVVVHDVVGFRSEKTTEPFVGKDRIKHKDFIDAWLSTSISDTGSSDQSCGDEVDFPKGSMREHHEGEATISDQSLGPHVIRAMKTRSDLVEVVSGTNAPFPVVSVHHVSHIGELRWISFSFRLKP